MRFRVKKFLIYMVIISTTFVLIVAHPNSAIKAQDYFHTWVEDSHNKAGQLISRP